MKKSKKQWHEKNVFWEAMTPFLFSPEKIRMAKEEVNQILKLFSFAPKAKLLDLGCGVGRHSILLAKKGFQVTGLDRTPFYLEQARQAAKKEKVSVIWLQQDMRKLRVSGFYDGVLSLYTSFGYFDSDREHLEVVKKIYRSLKPKGAFIMELAGQDVFRRLFRIRRQWDEQNGVYMLEETNPTPDWKYLRNRRLLIQGVEKKKMEFSIRLFSGQEIKNLLRKAGFRKIRLYGGFNGTPYNHSAYRLAVVAEK